MRLWAQMEALEHPNADEEIQCRENRQRRQLKRDFAQVCAESEDLVERDNGMGGWEDVVQPDGMSAEDKQGNLRQRINGS